MKTLDTIVEVEPLHDRMPVILPEDKYPLWLDPKQQDKNVL